MSADLVTLRCGDCYRVLHIVTEDDAPPPQHSRWSDPQTGVWFEACHRHGGVPETLDAIRDRRHAAGQPEVDPEVTMHFMSWPSLRQHVQKARARGRVVSFDVSPKARRL